jgi:methionyl-tRNA formyltransferase
MILCGRSARHIYVANRLCQAGKPLAIVNEVGSNWTKKKVLNLLKPWVLGRKVWRWLRDRKRYTGNPEAKFYFGSQEPSFDREDLIHEFPHINDPGVIALADRLQPDIICVFGTSLIKGELLEKGRLGILNLHGGLSPDYRGADCTFWALYNNEPNQIGCTLHFIDAGIDTGKLIAHICPQVKEGDSELPLFWRAVKDSAEVYAQALERLEKGEPVGQSQEHKGSLYQVKDRGWRHEKKLDEMLENGLLEGVDLPQRVTWFFLQGSTEKTVG